MMNITHHFYQSGADERLPILLQAADTATYGEFTETFHTTINKPHTPTYTYRPQQTSSLRVGAHCSVLADALIKPTIFSSCVHMHDGFRAIPEGKDHSVTLKKRWGVLRHFSFIFPPMQK